MMTNNKTTLTPPMEAAIFHARCNNGRVFAGADVYNGRIVRTAATVLRALERRGLVTLGISPDGGMFAMLKEGV